MKFYICEHCGNIITKLVDSNVPVMCCGSKMTELVPNSQEAAFEIHKPVLVEEDGNRYVVVGSVAHPMTPEHYIQWVAVDYGDHYRIYNLNPGDEPKVKVCKHCEPVAVYAYCNLHGLWNND